MGKRLIKVAACCLVGTISLTGNGILSYAAVEVPVAGMFAAMEEGAEAQVAQNKTTVVKSEYENIAIAQVDSYVNIRDAASLEGQIIGKLYNNSAATILGEEDGWYKIQSGTVVGYVKEEYFVTGDAAEELAKEVGQRTAIVNTTTLFVREEPSKDSDVIMLVGDSEKLEVIDEVDGWAQVVVDSDIGYVSTDYVETKTTFVEAESKEEEEARIAAAEAARIAAEEEARRADEEAEQKRLAEQQAQQSEITAPVTTTPETTAPVTITPETTAPVTTTPETTTPETTAPVTTAPETTAPETTASAADTSGSTTSASRQAIVNFAQQFVGNPYVYGGTSLTNGADCSGFVQSVFANFGISIPRVASSQAGSGREVAISDIQPGDLLFYSSGGSISHVTMYIGNGQVVHASSAATGIKISSVNYRTPCKAVSYID